MKRQLLDQLAARHDFDVPQGMVDAEYENILVQLRNEAAKEADPAAAMAEIERDSAEYRRISERRVRLGLLLSEIGAMNGIVVSEQEMQQIVNNHAAQYSGKDRETFLRWLEQDPTAQAQLRAPLYEDKVVDFLFVRCEIEDREATREELEADLQSEEGHVHGPGCGHDHAAPAKPAKAKKGKAAKAEAAPEPAVPVKDGAGGKPATKGKSAKAAKAEAKPAAAEAPKPAKPVKDGAGAKPAAKKAEAKPAAKKAAAKKK